jgi:hypothetical protein
MMPVNQILYEVVTMLYEEQNPFRRAPGLVTWLFWLVLTALGQWLLLRRFVAQSGWWLLTGLLGFIFVYPYLFSYGFSALLTNGQSLMFGTQEFWMVSLSLAIMSLIFGSLVGLLQGILVLRRWGAVPRRLICWVIGSAIAWGVGYALGVQFLASLLWHGPTPFPQAATVLEVGSTWGIIGAITGAVFIWVGRAHVKVRCCEQLNRITWQYLVCNLLRIY